MQNIREAFLLHHTRIQASRYCNQYFINHNFGNDKQSLSDITKAVNRLGKDRVLHALGYKKCFSRSGLLHQGIRSQSLEKWKSRGKVSAQNSTSSSLSDVLVEVGCLSWLSPFEHYKGSIKLGFYYTHPYPWQNSTHSKRTKLRSNKQFDPIL